MSVGRVHVFLGPSLAAPVARSIVPDAVLHPPVSQGDVLRALYDEPAALVIIDGFFELVPSVWHKEILQAISTGVPVLGAASMGALRAAELHQFGMIGHGTVFEWFRTGAIEDDDEVAVAHADADAGYRSLSHALVDLRHLFTGAHASGAIDDRERDALVDAARSIAFPDRHLVTAIEAAGLPPEAAERLRRFAAEHGPGLKEQDALSVLELVAATPVDQLARPARPVDVERTVFLHDLEVEVDLARAGGRLDDPAPLRGTDTVPVMRKKILLRLLARQRASALPLPVSNEELADELARFRSTHALEDDDALRSWCRTEGISDEALLSFIIDSVLVEKLQMQHRFEIDALMADQLRISTARLRDAIPGAEGDQGA